MASETVWPELVRLVREQRHDFLNHLQVISGYLQIRKVDRAVAYLESVQNKMRGSSSIFRLYSPELIWLFLCQERSALERGLRFYYEVEAELRPEGTTELELVRLVQLLWQGLWDCLDRSGFNQGLIRVRTEALGDREELSINFRSDDKVVAVEQEIPRAWREVATRSRQIGGNFFVRAGSNDPKNLEICLSLSKD